MKSKLYRFLGIAYFLVFTNLLFLHEAQAYIDAATTSYIIQIFAGIAIACGAAVAIFWKKIRLFFRDLKMKRLEKKLTKKAEQQEDR